MILMATFKPEYMMFIIIMYVIQHVKNTIVGGVITLNGMLCKTYLSMRVCKVSSKDNSLQCVEYKPYTIGQNFLTFFLYGKQQQQYDNSFQAATGSL